MASGTRLDIWNRALRRIGSDILQEETEDRPEAEDLRLHFDDCLREALEARRWPWAKRQRSLVKADSQPYTWAGNGATVVFGVPFPYLESAQLEVAHVVGGVATVLTAGSDYTVAPVLAPPPYANVTLTAIVPAIGESVRITVTASRVGWEHLFSLPGDLVTPCALLVEDQRLELTPTDERIEWDRLIDDSGTGYLLATNLDAGEFEVLEYVAFITHVPAWPALFVNAMVYRCMAELMFGAKKKPAEGEAFMRAYEKAIGLAFGKAKNAREPGPPPVSPSMRARGLVTDPRSRWGRR